MWYNGYPRPDGLGAFASLSSVRRTTGMPDSDNARERADALVEDRMRQLVASAPPLTEDQRGQLAALLAP